MKSIFHFQHEFPLPQNSTLRPYQHPQISLHKKKNKQKLTKFTYYRSTEGIIKILFLNDDQIIDQGIFPFTDPSGKVRLFKEISNIQRMIITQAVYIGHFVDVNQQDQNIKIVIKKINEATISLQTSQVETVDDHFQFIDVGNLERFNQFMKIQKFNPHSQQMSIRVMINEEGKVIDFQFFEREAKLKENKLVQSHKQLKQA